MIETPANPPAGIEPHPRAFAPRFLFYVLASPTFQDYAAVNSAGSTFLGLAQSTVGEFVLRLPPLAAQQAIADFLDRKTAVIDELIAKKERLVALLAEKRQALITQLVTKGLDPSVPMKDSGVGWIGGVPTSWEVAKICLVARLESGHTPSRQHPEYWVPEECTTPWFSLADIWQLRPGIQEYVSETAERISASGMANSAARLLPAGTVVLSRTASVGFSGIMAQPMATTQDFANWIPGPRLSSEFLLYGLRAMVSEFERVRYGSTHQTIYMPDIRRLTIPLPSREVQAAIVSALRAELGRVDAAADRMRQSVERLREYRQALITAAVTGQIDVSDERAVAAHDERVDALGG